MTESGNEIFTPKLWVAAPAIRDGTEHQFELLENGVLSYDGTVLAALELTPSQVLATLMLNPDTMLTTSQVMPDSEQLLRESSRTIRETLRGLIAYSSLQPHIRVKNSQGEAESYFGYMIKPLDILPEDAPNNMRRNVGRVATAENPPIIRSHAPSVPSVKQAQKPVIVESKIAEQEQPTSRRIPLIAEGVAPVDAAKLTKLAQRYKGKLKRVIDTASLDRLNVEDLIITGMMQQELPGIPHSIDSTWLNLQAALSPLQSYDRQMVRAAWLRYVILTVNYPPIKARVQVKLIPSGPQNQGSKEPIMRWVPGTLAKTTSYR